MDRSGEVSVRVPSALRQLVGGRSEVRLRGRTPEEVLAAIRRDEPLLAGHLFADDGTVRGYVNVYVDGTELRHLDPEAEFRPDAILSIVPSVAGG